jgi:hypothetical protein
VTRDAPARFAEEQPAQRVVAVAKRAHLVEDRLAGGRQHPAHDDVPDLAARMAADHGDRPARAHLRG